MRNYGRFTTSIFRDDDFRTLTSAQQGVYFLLGLQPEMSAAGTLSLTLRRWSAMSEDMTPDRLRDELKVLEDRGHIIVDEETEELLLVKFVKWDGGVGNEKRRPVIDEAACSIASVPIRHRLAYELMKLGHPNMAFRVSLDGATAAQAEAQSGSDRSVETLGESVPHPLSSIPEGEPSPPDDFVGPPSLFCSKHPNGTEKPCGPCGTAKLRFAAWQKSAGARQRAAIALRDACGECDDAGMLLDPDTRKPVSRCSHESTAATA